MSILQEILQSEQKATHYKESAEEERKQMIEEARKQAKLETKQTLDEAVKQSELIILEKEAELASLDEAFLKEINELKEELLKDIEAKQTKAFHFLLEVIL